MASSSIAGKSRRIPRPVAEYGAGSQVPELMVEGALTPSPSAKYRAGFVGLDSSATNSDKGEGGEHFVASDLLWRGLKVTKPLNRNGADDLHAKIGRRWYTIQVKLARRHRRTGRLRHAHGSRPITSDILAIVDPTARAVLYRALRGALPRVLREVIYADL